MGLAETEKLRLEASRCANFGDFIIAYYFVAEVLNFKVRLGTVEVEASRLNCRNIEDDHYLSSVDCCITTGSLFES